MDQEVHFRKNSAWPSCPTTWITGVIWTHKTMCTYFYIARDTCVRDYMKSYRALRQVDEKRGRRARVGTINKTRVGTFNWHFLTVVQSELHTADTGWGGGGARTTEGDFWAPMGTKIIGTEGQIAGEIFHLSP